MYFCQDRHLAGRQYSWRAVFAVRRETAGFRESRPL
jgi:hypothetical protein